MRRMKKEKIAAQLYTVRDYCNDAHEIVESLKKVRSIGFKAVQLSSLGPLPPHELVRVLDGEGLTCCSTHEDSEELLTDPEAVIERLSILRCTAAAYQSPNGQDLSTLEGVKRLCKALSRTGKLLKKAGITFAYHNHSLEFHRINGRTVLEWIMSETDPEYLEAELDTYWVQAGGGDTVEWLARVKGRASLIHLKDFGVDPKGKATYEEIGQGNLTWGRIIPAAKRAGCRWYIIEQDSDWEAGDPFESLKLSLAYLKKTFVE
jgi:sugar phosphate isomerase/epimerase